MSAVSLSVCRSCMLCSDDFGRSLCCTWSVNACGMSVADDETGVRKYAWNKRPRMVTCVYLPDYSRENARTSGSVQAEVILYGPMSYCSRVGWRGCRVLQWTQKGGRLRAVAADVHLIRFLSRRGPLSAIAVVHEIGPGCGIGWHFRCGRKRKSGESASEIGQLIAGGRTDSSNCRISSVGHTQ